MELLIEYTVNTLAFIGGTGLLFGAITLYQWRSDARLDAKRDAEYKALELERCVTRTRDLVERIATKVSA